MDKVMEDDSVTNTFEIAAKVASICEEGAQHTLKAEELYKLCNGRCPLDRPLLYRYSYPFQRFLFIKNQTPNYNRTDLRKFLMKKYVTYGCVPTLSDLVVFSRAKEYSGIDTFFYLVSYEGFVWRNIPGTTKAIFMEKYENVAKRMKYLTKMREYRRLDRHIVYLECFTYSRCHTNDTLGQGKFYLAVSNRHGILSLGLTLKTTKKERIFKSLFTHHTQFGLRLDELIELTKNVPKRKLLMTGKPKADYWTATQAQRFAKDIGDRTKEDGNEISWIKEIFRTVNEPTVFVYEDLPFSHQELIAPFTAKSVMLEYIRDIGIPHDPNAHRTELYRLIKKFTKDKCESFSEIIRSHNHEVALFPYQFKELDFYNSFWPETGTTNVSAYKFQESEKSLITAEETLLATDRTMEQVIDNLMTMGKDHPKFDGSLTEYITVMKYDDEYGYNSIFVD